MLNEKIKEIALQAGGSHYPSVNPKQLELFAELFLKECIGVVENLSPGYSDYRNQIEDAFRADCIIELKRHFGFGDE